ncbi:Haloacid dehalogenase-like hydrolase domain-containing 5 [Vitis vinifera]|uniref:Haloacid dehalogenase-like hydrolase domain-containing 5 n=1 Tax=Vitis vinifera TaxID=29760 RepID=A0A438FA31_VITVI|nr:Haloacid dehalogenase-like hydrolase domain-containing 5 [Vitis vinifera]
MLRIIFKNASQSRSKPQSCPFFSIIARSYSQLHSQIQRPSFGIAFDIDGVVLLGNTPIGGSSQALKRLYDDCGANSAFVALDSSSKLKIPYIFLTNGGGFHESKRASELSELLGVNILPSQVVQGHSPFKQLVKRYITSEMQTNFIVLLLQIENELVIAVGKGEPAAVMSEYGFKNVLSIDEYSSCFDNIDPLAQYKKWSTKQEVDQNSTLKMKTLFTHREFRQHLLLAILLTGAGTFRLSLIFSLFDHLNISLILTVRGCYSSLKGFNNPAVMFSGGFVDLINLERGKKVLCDVLRTGGLPGRETGHQPPLYFANDDLEYQAAFPSERLGMGAFRIALEAIFNRIHPKALEYTSFGKPSPSVFKNAETILSQLVSSLHHNLQAENHGNAGSHPFKTLYMIGDNPSVDINGARQEWDSIFCISGRTSMVFYFDKDRVFKGKENHAKFPADLVVDTVEEAVDFILTKECSS